MEEGKKAVLPETFEERILKVTWIPTCLNFLSCGEVENKALVSLQSKENMTSIEEPVRSHPHPQDDLEDGEIEGDKKGKDVIQRKTQNSKMSGPLIQNGNNNVAKDKVSYGRRNEAKARHRRRKEKQRAKWAKAHGSRGPPRSRKTGCLNVSKSELTFNSEHSPENPDCFGACIRFIGRDDHRGLNNRNYDLRNQLLHKKKCHKFRMRNFAKSPEKCRLTQNAARIRKELPCKYHHTGQRCLNTAKACKFSHEPLTEETRAILVQHLAESLKMTRDQASSNPCATGPRHTGWGTEEVQKEGRLQKYESQPLATFITGSDKFSSLNRVANELFFEVRYNSNLMPIGPRKPVKSFGHDSGGSINMDTARNPGHANPNLFGFGINNGLRPVDSEHLAGDRQPIPPAFNNPQLSQVGNFSDMPYGHQGGENGGGNMCPSDSGPTTSAQLSNLDAGILGPAPGMEQKQLGPVHTNTAMQPPQQPLLPTMQLCNGPESFRFQQDLQNFQHWHKRKPSEEQEATRQQMPINEPNLNETVSNNLPKQSSNEADKFSSSSGIALPQVLSDMIGPLVKKCKKPSSPAGPSSKCRDPRSSNSRIRRDPRMREKLEPLSQQRKDGQLLDLDLDSVLDDLELPTFKESSKTREDSYDARGGLMPDSVLPDEIDASIYSHSHIKFQLRSLVVCKPDYLDVIVKHNVSVSQAQLDPRLCQHVSATKTL